jgi:hypothetical protein
VVRRVTRGVQGTQREARAGELEAVPCEESRLEAVASAEADHLGPRAGRQPAGTRGVVRTDVGDGDPTDTARPEVGNGVEMAGVVRPRVDHHQLGRADDIRVGPRTGHHRGIGGGGAGHQW